MSADNPAPMPTDAPAVDPSQAELAKGPGSEVTEALGGAGILGATEGEVKDPTDAKEVLEEIAEKVDGIADKYTDRDASSLIPVEDEDKMVLEPLKGIPTLETPQILEPAKKMESGQLTPDELSKLKSIIEKLHNGEFEEAAVDALILKSILEEPGEDASSDKLAERIFPEGLGFKMTPEDSEAIKSILLNSEEKGSSDEVKAGENLWSSIVDVVKSRNPELEGAELEEAVRKAVVGLLYTEPIPVNPVINPKHTAQAYQSPEPKTTDQGTINN